MKAKGKFISAVLVIDTFFISFALAFNARPVLVVDPSLPPVAKAIQADKNKAVEKPKTGAAEKKPDHSNQANPNQANPNQANPNQTKSSQSHPTQSHSDKKSHVHKKSKHATKSD